MEVTHDISMWFISSHSPILMDSILDSVGFVSLFAGVLICVWGVAHIKKMESLSAYQHLSYFIPC